MQMLVLPTDWENDTCTINAPSLHITLERNGPGMEEMGRGGEGIGTEEKGGRRGGEAS